MTRNDGLLLVGGNEEVLEKARALGVRVLMLQHPGKVTTAQRDRADAFLALDYTDWALTEPVVRELRRSPGFTAAVAGTETGLEPAGRINDLFSLGGTGYQVAHLLRDKLAMREHLYGRTGVVVGAMRLTSRDDLTAFAARYGYPLIVKPANATASIGVFLVTDPAEADQAWAGARRLAGTRTDRGSVPFLLDDFIIEEYVDGPELSVESVSFAGRHVIVAITEKFIDPDSFTELGHALPARLDPSVRGEVRQAVTSFLDLVGIRDGVCHTEVRLGPRGPAIIEGHNRPGGDAIADLVQGAFGVDLISSALGWQLGLVPELPDEVRPLAGACTRFLVGPPGRVESVDGVEAARAQDGVLCVRIGIQPGATVRPVTDNLDRLGLIAVTGADTSDAIARAAQIAAEFIRIRIVAGDGTVHLAHVADIAQTASTGPGA